MNKTNPGKLLSENNGTAPQHWLREPYSFCQGDGGGAELFPAGWRLSLPDRQLAPGPAHQPAGLGLRQVHLGHLPGRYPYLSIKVQVMGLRSRRCGSYFLHKKYSMFKQIDEAMSRNRFRLRDFKSNEVFIKQKRNIVEHFIIFSCKFIKLCGIGI